MGSEPDYSRPALARFIDFVVDKNLVHPATAQGWRVATSKVLEELPPEAWPTCAGSTWRERSGPSSIGTRGGCRRPRWASTGEESGGRSRSSCGGWRILGATPSEAGRRRRARRRGVRPRPRDPPDGAGGVGPIPRSGGAGRRLPPSPTEEDISLQYPLRPRPAGACRRAAGSDGGGGTTDGRFPRDAGGRFQTRAGRRRLSSLTPLRRHSLRNPATRSAATLPTA